MSAKKTRQRWIIWAAGILLAATSTNSTLEAQEKPFKTCPHGENEPPEKPPIRPFPSPGLAPNIWLAADGLVVNDTNESHIIVIHTAGTISNIEVAIYAPVNGGVRRVGGKCFATADVIARGGRMHVYCHGGDDVVRNHLWLPMNAYGGRGDDALYGNDCCDILFGGDGDDVLYGHAGCDLLEGGDGNDILVGGGETDRIRGGPGHDLLDAIDGPAYRDYVNGGPGVDIFDTNGDKEEDFDPSEDVRP